ncbi:hypothetical protein C8N46_104176 [Kordia periserrulae]|uniref:Uncharacterized protein n=1 Tax=Kordia periserrulae TaxID=701523 RepID=A0A2T6BZN3_9FLAO|nr:hypothetical protein [Kordia periserrulae]PTX61533.1 hypothetical protein C8N46_104176 [Kordia periserrulae]
MKKRNLKSLKVRKSIISNFKKEKIKGGDTDNSWQLTHCCNVQKH